MILSAMPLHGDASDRIWPRCEPVAHEVTDPQPCSPCTTYSWMWLAACSGNRGGGGSSTGGCDGQRQERHGRKEGGEQSRLRSRLSLPAVTTRRAPSRPAVLMTPPPPSSRRPRISLILLSRPHHPPLPESDGFLSRPAPSDKWLSIPAPPGCVRTLTPPRSIAIAVAAAAATSGAYATTSITLTTATDLSTVATPDTRFLATMRRHERR